MAATAAAGENAQKTKMQNLTHVYIQTHTRAYTCGIATRPAGGRRKI